MSISNAAENAILDLWFRATAWANIADNAAGSPQANIGFSLHTGDPGDGGDASTSEVGYTSYTRINKTRDNHATTGFAAPSGGSISFNTNADFPAGTGGSGAVTHFAAGRSNATPPTGAQAIHMSGSVSPTINCGNGVQPRLTPATTFTLD